MRHIHSSRTATVILGLAASLPVLAQSAIAPARPVQPIPVTINVSVEGIANPDARFYLLTRLPGQPQLQADTITADKGQFTITKNLDQSPEEAFLFHDKDGKGLKQEDRSQHLHFFLDKETITIHSGSDLRSAVITGSPVNDEMKRYIDFISVPNGDDPKWIYPLNGLEVMNITVKPNAPANTANAVLHNPGVDTSATAKIRHERQAQQRTDQQQMLADRQRLIEARHVLQEKYLNANPDSYFSLRALAEICGHIITEPEQKEALFNKLSERLRNSPEGQALLKRIHDVNDPIAQKAKMDRLEKMRQEAEITEHPFPIGSPAPDFTETDVNGKPVKLSDFKGKYVLIDFWASWCGPCRKENPNVISAYNEYKDHNFTVLGVSLERTGDKTAWQTAIKKDGLPWTQVADLTAEAFENPAAKLYHVSAIPMNFLIDPDGKIVAYRLRGDDLQNKLAELLNK